MYTSISAEEATFSNQDFWLFYLAVAYDRAFDEQKEINFTDVLEERNYIIHAEYVEKYILIEIREGLTLVVEFNPTDISFYMNDFNIGYTGGHFHLKFLTWTELLKLAAASDYGRLLFLLFLPVVAVEQHEAGEAAHQIARRLEDLPIKKQDCDYFSKCILNGLVTEDGNFEEIPGKGLISKANHSLRKFSGEAGGQDDEEQQELLKINQLLAAL
ncbi:Imm19 family immunity protein [Paenibacillus eucommiae]|uniref:Uncharacterized protein n=1 Tax=Paenibacillus eucommiae TaxID=1355755 RepID=A0ABS4J1D8_9BACL|nr:Imm19 family immunity protein [Paenibacillus eucommiae]MBP1993649.1 hypothetical protein [Paenibacillus eucommiae]